MLLKSSFIFWHKNRGFTLIEMMIGIVLALILLVGVISLSTSIIGYSVTMAKTNRLNYELQMAMDLVSGDISRAGYWANASSQAGSGANQNPFMSDATDITVSSINSGTNNCILLTYDKDQNGALSTDATANSNEHFGFRLTNGAIQALTSDAHYSCTDTDSSWQNLTDPNVVNVTNLSFNKTTTSIAVGATAITTIRSVTITISGQLTADATISTVLTNTVLVNNDRFTP